MATEQNQDFDGARFYLASASPRRRELLGQIGYTFSVIGVSVDETPLANEDAGVFVRRLARQKAEAGWLRVRDSRPLPVLGADTTVVVDGEMLNKPESFTDARYMLLRLSGRAHRVLTAVTVTDGIDTRTKVGEAEVVFRPLREAEIQCYWDLGEPRDKAGAYAIQGRGAVFVERIVGSYSAVVGLPLYETAQLLESFGVGCWSGETRVITT